MGKLTHRAVAAQVNVSLSTVSARFRTSVDLVSAAFEMIYRRLATPEEATPVSAPLHGKEEPITATARVPSRLSYRLAMEELMLAVSRNGALQSFAPQLRDLRGRSNRRTFCQMVGQGTPVS